VERQRNREEGLGGMVMPLCMAGDSCQAAQCDFYGRKLMGALPTRWPRGRGTSWGENEQGRRLAGRIKVKDYSDSYSWGSNEH